jgi:hypothetical protein
VTLVGEGGGGGFGAKPSTHIPNKGQCWYQKNQTSIIWEGNE